MFKELEDYLETGGETEMIEVFPLCGLCHEPLVDGEVTAHSACHRAEHTRSYLQDAETIFLTK